MCPALRKQKKLFTTYNIKLANSRHKFNNVNKAIKRLLTAR